MPDGMPNWVADGLEFLYATVPSRVTPLTGVVLALVLTLLVVVARKWR